MNSISLLRLDSSKYETTWWKLRLDWENDV